MAEKQIRFGTLTETGRLAGDGETWLLTEAASSTVVDPASATLVVAEDQRGQSALVRGRVEGGVIYEAEILEVVPALTGSLIRSLITRDVISLDDLRDNLPSPADKPAPEKLCALVIGHKKTSPGAINEASAINEFDFNDELARRIEQKIQTVGVQRVYRRTYRELPDDVNALEPDFVVSLHCNAFNGQASGSEVLYYHRSEKGRQAAETVLSELVGCLGLADRGVRPKAAEDRGGYLLRYTKAPCVIAEPFFIDNDGDLAVAREQFDALAAAYARAIDALGSLL